MLILLLALITLIAPSKWKGTFTLKWGIEGQLSRRQENN